LRRRLDHAIRHLSASILAKNGVPSIQIQAILRHKKLSTTEKYLHRIDDLKSALTLLGKNKKPSKEPSVAMVIEMKNRVAV
jgi:site-specific recombinase XerD